MNDIIAISVVAVLAFVVCAVTGPFIIPFLRRLKFGQKILEIGPSWHKSKSGTPTMGGIIFIISTVLAALLLFPTTKGFLLCGISVAFGLIGFADDFIKVVKKRNLGLTSIQKLLLQIFVSLIFVFIGEHYKLFDTSITVPFVSTPLNLSWVYFPFAVFVMVGVTNSVNLTDGVDGLASSVSAVVSIFFTFLAIYYNEGEIAMFCAAVTGGCLGFLLFNANPAKVFMGDTGSLFLGGAICGAALMLEAPLVLVIAGGVFVFETVSVIIQVISFKTRGKRVFKMTPVHHHFEMCGWSEKKIVITAVAASAILCALAYISCI
ncbi:MAG: phospho-N-acetylmuramoyl-pentapeptide-transferase [Ruminococcaceae bacterium]|nr:phospho-N-acetylmuramoyl-pentapeptide-transferase [Oscillospiraceae bacterium]